MPLSRTCNGISRGCGVFGSGARLSRLTWQPSHGEGRPCAGCRRLAGSRCVVAFCVHIHLDYVLPFGNFERKQRVSASPPLPSGTGQCWSRAKLRGRSEDPAGPLGSTRSLESLPQNLSFGPSSPHKAPCLGLVTRAAFSQRGGTAHARRKGISSDAPGTASERS